MASVWVHSSDITVSPIDRKHVLVAGFRQKGVQSRHHLRAIADRSGDTFGRSRAHVADCEYAGQTGFERPEKVGAGAHKALVVEHHARAGQPGSIRVRADKQKQVTDRPAYLLARPAR